VLQAAQFGNPGGIANHVRRAEGLARQIVLNAGVTGGDTVEFSVQGLVDALIGHDGPKHLDEEGYTALFEALDAAYAIGIAVGLLLRPDVFAKGGAR
jgi:hypothetical protein